MTSIDVSVLLTAHREGLVGHKTLRSIKRALTELARNKVSFEVLVHLDNADVVTREYFRSQKVLKTEVFENKFGDLGKSRNFLVQQAQGKFVATIDADDLMAANWLIEAFNYLNNHKKELVVHTEYSLNFGDKNVLWPKTNSLNLENERLINVSINRWDSAMMCRRTTLESYPYSSNTRGFGPEDWFFNCQTLNAGIEHHVVPHTVLYVRRRSDSLMVKQAKNFHSPTYTDLLDINEVKKIDLKKLSLPSEKSKRKKSTAVREAVNDVKHMSIMVAKRFKISANLLTKMRKRSQKKRPSFTRRREVPQWLYENWLAIHEIEKELFPSREIQENLVVYQSDFIKPPGEAYKRIFDNLTSDHIDHLIIVPWLSKGGADLVALRYANLLSELYPLRKIAVFATKNVDSPWSKKLTKQVDFVELGKLTKHLSDNDTYRLVSRIIVQAKVRSVQIINSEVGFEWAERHKELITKNNITIYAAAYCKDINKEGKQVGFIHTHLGRIYSIVDKIFTDNQNIINSLTKEYGFSPEKFKVHYQPVDKTKSSWQINKKQKNRFLWAGRISLQKRPDLIIGIAKKLKIVNPAAIIEAYGTVGAHYHNVIAEAKLENLKYKGDFDGFYNLNLNDYSAFIYTSDYDGVPNILLEAMNIGIPIIASDVGGVSEVIKDGINGYLVNHNDANTFVETIKNLQLLKPAEIKKFSNESKKILDLQHNNDKYKQILKEDIRL